MAAGGAAAAAAGAAGPGAAGASQQRPAAAHISPPHLCQEGQGVTRAVCKGSCGTTPRCRARPCHCPCCCSTMSGGPCCVLCRVPRRPAAGFGAAVPPALAPLRRAPAAAAGGGVRPAGTAQYRTVEAMRLMQVQHEQELQGSCRISSRRPRSWVFANTRIHALALVCHVANSAPLRSARVPRIAALPTGPVPCGPLGTLFTPWQRPCVTDRAVPVPPRWPPP